MQPSKSLQSNDFFIKNGKDHVRVNPDEILWVEAQGNYLALKTETARYFIYGSMRSIEKLLPSGKFVRASRSYIVALEKITEINGKTLKINGHNVPMSIPCRQLLLKRVTIL